ncbi:hypothetical protein Q31a_54890 [Aureliella helgolandensis]|uniref:Uncharacterized protein n=1 Tax=Aureliella helgolandensis TaxID=2527968 RepID=A0A518GET0_9BACT|nr:hypothetical protein Q31a_54890 [Aureliella helgolandensis]
MGDYPVDALRGGEQRAVTQPRSGGCVKPGREPQGTGHAKPESCGAAAVSGIACRRSAAFDFLSTGNLGLAPQAICDRCSAAKGRVGVYH